MGCSTGCSIDVLPIVYDNTWLLVWVSVHAGWLLFWLRGCSVWGKLLLSGCRRATSPISFKRVAVCSAGRKQCWSCALLVTGLVTGGVG